MDLKNVSKSKNIKEILIILGVIVLVLGVFALGIETGYQKAKFGRHFADNYHKNFEPPNHGPMSAFPRMDLPPGGHGAVGKIVSVNLPNLVVASTDNLEKTIVVKENTLIREFRDEGSKEDLKVGDFVVVIGSPNDQGQIEAELIRIMPEDSSMDIGNNMSSTK